ncbi:hypothetical protein M8C21_003600 [Ambrosia artemisiifolia]|uniref:Uncharacterized protein n=1 Tax=Ambrosia artemisiifolia TaxID=4212 RepID=A0AAD5BQY3_AMBAR|nr:hypothetical protein M8C21_003600 [Ambrosia artemisiifolia]
MLLLSNYCLCIVICHTYYRQMLAKMQLQGKSGRFVFQINRSNQMEYEHLLFTNFNQLWPLVNLRRAISLAMLVVVLANGNGASWVEFD